MEMYLVPSHPSKDLILLVEGMFECIDYSGKSFFFLKKMCTFPHAPPGCNKEVEPVEHAFFGCKHYVKIWNISNLLCNIDAPNDVSLIRRSSNLVAKAVSLSHTTYILSNIAWLGCEEEMQHFGFWRPTIYDINYLGYFYLLQGGVCVLIEN